MISLSTLRPAHPRLVFTSEREAELRDRLTTDPLLAELVAAIRRSSDRLAAEPPVEFKSFTFAEFGIQMLDTCRAVMLRVINHAFLYRLTREPVYVARAWREIENALAFPTWNPAHFLDAAEMLAGIAFGYDWLFDALTPEQRATLRTAMVERVLKPGLQVHETRQGPSSFFPTTTSNWNGVGNSGLLAGALAIAEDEPALAEAILRQAVPSLAYPESGYEPDGASEEGPTYWGYGTDFLCLAAAVLESALGSTAGVTGSSAVARTALYRLHAESPTGRNFQYADCWPRSDAGFAYARLASLHGPAPARAHVRRLLADCAANYGKDPGSRLHPLMAFWLPVEEPAAEAPLDAYFGGRAEVAMFRSAWGDPRAAYLGFKAGHAIHNHSHLDLGSFVFDARGVRWSADLGPDAYALDGYFRHEENANNRLTPENAHRPHRWSYLRNNNRGHSTLTLGGDLQSRAAHAPIVRHGSRPEFAFAVADLSTAYPGHAQAWQRGVALVDRAWVVVRDELTGLQSGVAAEWVLMTEAAVTLAADARSATLTRDGETLALRIVKGPAGARLTAAPALPPTALENQNDGITRLVIGWTATNSDEAIEVHLVPQGLPPTLAERGPLARAFV